MVAYGGRNSPNNSRSFDEPYFSWNDSGGSSSGRLPTDRPSTFKGHAYYELGCQFGTTRSTTDLGFFQYFYSGSPATSFADVELDWRRVAGRCSWIAENGLTSRKIRHRRAPFQSATPGLIELRGISTPIFQLGAELQESARQKVVSFSATFANLFNQRSVTAYNQQVDTGYKYQAITPVGNGHYTRGTRLYSCANGPFACITEGLVLSLLCRGYAENPYSLSGT